jgi:hypothetical protein
MEETVGKSSTSRLQIYPSPSDTISPYLRGEENFAFFGFIYGSLVSLHFELGLACHESAKWLEFHMEFSMNFFSMVLGFSNIVQIDVFP